MSRDLFGEFGDFQSGGTTTSTGGGGSTTTNNAFSTASPYATQSNASGNSNFDDLLGLFNSPAPVSSTTYPPPSQVNNINNSNIVNNNNNNKSLHSNFQSTTSEAIVSNQSFTNTHNSNSNYNSNYNYNSNPTSTTLFTTSPNQNPIFDNDNDDDDDFGDFAVEPLPSTNPTFGPLSNNSPPQKPSIPTIHHPQIHPQEQKDDNNNNDDDDFGTFISTPRIPTPPPTFSLSSTITNTNYLHPLHPPPALHALLPLLTTQLLSPSPFLTRLKPLSYPAKQRLLTSIKVKTFFISIVMVSHVVGRIIAGRKVRGRRSYKGKGIESNGSNNGNNKKNEGLKDEREVGECVREYNEIVGSLRAVVRGMGVVVVELSGEMSISSPSTSTLSSGNKKGKKGGSNTTTGTTEFCWLCGLSPVDKVVKLKEDESIEVGKDIDGGERWVSGWGHRGCRNWWGECGGRFGV
ncbi:hypothetical protein TWF173_000659 [Orbilia oligospora]|nr:hypothetical protein TWF173_000659 [Orbilia oligospora]